MTASDVYADDTGMLLVPRHRGQMWAMGGSLPAVLVALAVAAALFASPAFALALGVLSVVGVGALLLFVWTLTRPEKVTAEGVWVARQPQTGLVYGFVAAGHIESVSRVTEGDLTGVEFRLVGGARAQLALSARKRDKIEFVDQMVEAASRVLGPSVRNGSRARS